MLRQVPSKAVVSTFIRSQCCSARWPRPPQRRCFLNSSPEHTALMPKPPSAGRTSPSPLRAQSTSVPQVKLNAAFPRVVASLKNRLAYACNLTCVRYKLWPDSGNTTKTSLPSVEPGTRADFRSSACRRLDRLTANFAAVHAARLRSPRDGVRSGLSRACCC